MSEGSATSCIMANADGENTAAAGGDSQFLERPVWTLGGGGTIYSMLHSDLLFASFLSRLSCPDFDFQIAFTAALKWTKELNKNIPLSRFT